ncbi:hypothetical protein DPMN_182855 [Dreissena polymorpha]|uniref:Uncharacterized protein n=1 Tax=Dreissena polymorpha TaxID=45954 RepID=A0A9D4DH42_DREPO|nr:hypothetical protein DPMN_182855 [Dreissena polymorpha]
MVDLCPSLWRQFQQEQTSLLYKYLNLNDQFRSQTPQPQQQQPWGTPQPPQQQWQPGQQTKQSATALAAFSRELVDHHECHYGSRQTT